MPNLRLFKMVGTCLAALWAVAAEPAYSQNSTTAKTSAPAATASPSPLPSPTPEAAPKKKKKKKVAAEPKEPEDAAPPVQTTKIEPSLIYRTAAVTPVRSSIYAQPDFSNYGDQIYMTFHFERTYNYEDEVVVEPALRTMKYDPAKWDEPVVHQAFIQSALTPNLAFTVGKKTEFTGSGFFVTPSDLLNEYKDQFDPIYQQEGVEFIRLKYHNDTAAVAVGFLPDPDHPAQDGKVFATGSTELLGTDINLELADQQAEKTTTGLSLERFFGSVVDLHFDGRYQMRQRDLAGLGNQYLAYSAYAGNNATNPGASLPSLYYATGGRFVLSPRRSIGLEGIIDQSGLAPSEFQQMYTDVKNGEVNGTKGIPDVPTRIQGRHYSFVTFQDDETIHSTHLGASFLRNLDDGSNFITGSVRYTMSPITSLEFAPTFFLGGPDTEFGQMPFSHVYYLVFRGRF